jgi:hypothetical protein
MVTLGGVTITAHDTPRAHTRLRELEPQREKN